MIILVESLKLTSVPYFPALWKRRGECIRCGWCCYFIKGDFKVKCPHLQYLPDGTSYCDGYPFRPEICKVYPMAPNPLNPNCGYRFEWIGDKNGTK